MKAAVLRPDLPNLFPAPPELQAYVVERQFFQEFGAAQPPLHLWPDKKLRDYSIIMQVIGEVEREQQAAREREAATRSKSPAGAPGGANKAAATEEAYRRMREQAGLGNQPPA